MIDGVAGVIIWTENMAAMAAFYRDTLGMPVHSERPHFVAFEWGEMRFSIGSHSEVHGRNAEPQRIMVNFGTSDIHALHERLTAAGVRFVRPPERSTGAGGSLHSRTRTGICCNCWSSRRDFRATRRFLLPSPYELTGEGNLCCP